MSSGEDKIGIAAAKAMERVEREFGDRNVEVRDAIVAVEVEFDDDDDDRAMTVLVNCSTTRQTVQDGIALRVLHTMLDA